MLITSFGRILVVNKVRERNNISSRLLLIEKEQENGRRSKRQKVTTMCKEQEERWS
jgi:hypothetical protein